MPSVGTGVRSGPFNSATGTTATDVPVSFSAAAHQAIVIAVTTVPGTVTAISDTSGNNYTKVVQNSASSLEASIWVCCNAAAFSAATGSVTFTFSATHNQGSYTIFAATGLAGDVTVAVDSTASNNGTGTALNSGTATPSNAGQVAFACYAFTSAPSITGTSGWASPGSFAGSAGVAGVYAEDLVPTGSGSVTSTPTSGTSITWRGVLAIFRANGKFYLHTGTTADTGTLPSTGASVSASTPTVIAAGGGTNRSMDLTIGTTQTSNALTTQNNTTAQSGLILRCCSAPVAAQTFQGSTWKIQAGYSQSNTNSVFELTGVAVVWRPSTGAVVGRLFDLSVASAAATTGETNVSITGTITSVTAADGDIIVAELWRASVAQTMSTAYTNTVFYDGTTEGSTTSNAAYVDLGTGILFSTTVVTGATAGILTVLQAVNRAAIY